MLVQDRSKTDPVEASAEFYQRYASLLTGPHVQKIGFKMRGVEVTPMAFRLVATALQSRRIRVFFDTDLLKKAKAVGSYSDGSNKIRFKSADVFNTIEGTKTAIHEATHAALDASVSCLKIASSKREEGAAFIAEHWYELNDSSAYTIVNGLKIRNGPVSGLSSNAFMDIAVDLKARAEKSGKLPVVLTDEQIRSARVAVTEFGYKPRLFWQNGLGKL